MGKAVLLVIAIWLAAQFKSAIFSRLFISNFDTGQDYGSYRNTFGKPDAALFLCFPFKTGPESLFSFHHYF